MAEPSVWITPWVGELIRETIGTNLCDRDVAQIEDILRGTIFHGTLDWQTEEQLRDGIKEAYEVMQEIEAESNGNLESGN